MSPEGVGHLSYVRERVHGHVFIVRCRDAAGTAVAGRLSYVPDASGPLRIEGRGYRKVRMDERSAELYPLLSRFARDAVHHIPLSAVDHCWDPFATRVRPTLSSASEIAAFAEALTAAMGGPGDGALGLIGSRLVATGSVGEQSDFDLAVRGAAAWATAAGVVDAWMAAGRLRAAPDDGFPEFEARRRELALDGVSMRSLRRRQWWRKLLIGEQLVSLSCVDALGSLPERILDVPAEVRVDPDHSYVACSAPYAVYAVPGSVLAGVLHLSWFLRQGFRGTASGRLAQWGGRQWVWVSSPGDLSLEP